MNDVCTKDCHACTLQDGIMNKSLCATLLIPAMIDRVFARLSAIEAMIVRHPEINEIALDSETAEVKEVKKPLKTTKNENIEE